VYTVNYTKEYKQVNVKLIAVARDNYMISHSTIAFDFETKEHIKTKEYLLSLYLGSDTNTSVVINTKALN